MMPPMQVSVELALPAIEPKTPQASTAAALSPPLRWPTNISAMETSGGAELLADVIVDNLAGLGPVAVLGGIFLVTQLLTSIISNNASAVLFAPIAIGTAQSLGADPRPFLFAVTAAASMSFMTPIGYQTNTMIYGPGQYRFTDFARIGGPLNLLVLAAATFLIPLIWPL